MQRRVLDYLYEQGGLTLFAFPGEEANYEALERFALAQNAGACFVVIDFTQKHDSSTGIPVKSLFETFLTEEDFDRFKAQENPAWTFAGFDECDKSENGFRIFYHNVELIKKKVPHIVAILPSSSTKDCNENIFKIARVTILTGSNPEAAATYLEDSSELQKSPIFWDFRSTPKRKTHPKASKAVKASLSKSKEFKKINWENHPEKFVSALTWLYKVNVLRQNPLDGMPKLFCRFFLLFLLAAICIPFTFTTKIESSLSNLRDRVSERDRLSMAPSFDYTFDGMEHAQRIARYAIGRFNAVITDEKMIQQYLQETMDENGYTFYKEWEKNNLVIPPAGTVVKFSRPDNLSRAAEDSIGAAWKYWTSIVTDSVAYITEFYHKEKTSKDRKHNGIDLASRKGARILAPFAAKAWTSVDERGGIIIGLVREKDVMIFMHCDQLLYLDGQEVMQGDPIATVGVTGHTTGPHAHIVTGEIKKNGSKKIGDIRYEVIDPIDWFYKYKPTSR